MQALMQLLTIWEKGPTRSARAVIPPLIGIMLHALTLPQIAFPVNFPLTPFRASQKGILMFQLMTGGG
ncbi:MAG: hypothetical protein C4586_07170 [Anaerolineaceae bacterium]|nr:MAG: hypothetical protein C4586_07170 [Anaerolineaceae bacterium]